MADVIEKLFSLFCPTWRTVLKMFAVFPDRASEGLEKKFSRSCLRAKTEETETKRFPGDLKNT